MRWDTINFGDLVLTPAIGYHAGNAHWVYAASIFPPTGYNEKASVNIPARSVDALSFGKNRWAIAPTAAYTWFNPETGYGFSGSGSVTILARNTATDYQTAPEAVLEAEVMQHRKSGFAFGLTGYGYQQLGEDSGSGAESLKAATNAASLEAQVYGLGRLCCRNRARDSSRESNVVAAWHEQTHIPRLQDQELARVE